MKNRDTVSISSGGGNVINLRAETLRSNSSMQEAKIYGLSPLEVVENALAIRWRFQWFDNYDYGADAPRTIARTFGDGMRNFEWLFLLKMLQKSIIYCNFEIIS